MFTGIIEDLGKTKRLERKRAIWTLALESMKEPPSDLKIGDSVSVNGVCLTLVKKEKNDLIFEVMFSTFKKTNLGFLKIGDRVNLEYALKVGDRLSGHFIYGHIDCMGIIKRRSYIENNLCFEISFPKEVSKYIIEKGSIAIDGVSLTVANLIMPGVFTIYITPFTLKNTNLQFRKIGDKVNLECDYLVKITGIQKT